MQIFPAYVIFYICVVFQRIITSEDEQWIYAGT